MSMDTYVKCLECDTVCGKGGKDTYAHMLGCLKVEPGAIERIRENALASRTVNGERVVHLCDAMLKDDAQPALSGDFGG